MVSIYLSHAIDLDHERSLWMLFSPLSSLKSTIMHMTIQMSYPKFNKS